jgi:hypothetical protein
MLVGFGYFFFLGAFQGWPAQETSCCLGTTRNAYAVLHDRRVWFSSIRNRSSRLSYMDIDTFRYNTFFFGSSRYYRDLRATITRHRRFHMCTSTSRNDPVSGAGTCLFLDAGFADDSITSTCSPRENDNRNTQETETRDGLTDIQPPTADVRKKVQKSLQSTSPCIMSRI